VQGAEVKKGKASVTYKLRKDDSEHELDADVRAGGHRPAALHRGAGPGGAGHRDDEGRDQIKTDGSSHQRQGHLRDRRRDRRPDAGAQGEDEGMAVAEMLAGQRAM
jgi:dihydrolipoamide dehydrogenase